MPGKPDPCLSKEQHMQEVLNVGVYVKVASAPQQF